MILRFPGVVFLFALSSCGGLPPSGRSESICASAASYDAVREQIADGFLPSWMREQGQKGRGAIALSPEALGKQLPLHSPTVEGTEGDTGKVSCSVVGDLKSEFAPLLTVPPSLEAKSISRNEIALRIEFTVQPAADGSGVIVRVKNAGDIAQVVFQAAALSQHPLRADEQGAEVVVPTEEASPSADGEVEADGNIAND